MTSPLSLEPGARLGSYRLLSELGRGGMAVVYLAERADGQYEQRVALKILERPASDGRAVARFERERRILASLEHAGIARIVDGGVAADGRPWFAMEHVEGATIDVYCDEHGLDLRARLRLFAEVSRAVSHAHRQLVVHRDIKPSNILVGKDGAPKLLDFGIAGLISPDGEAPGDPEQARAAVSMTPRYASPEQVSGGVVTTSSDVYQLGLLLRDLSSAVSEAGRSSRRDLDTIVQSCLRPEPERRYESGSRLAEDVERYLAGRPITARADSLGYRAAKFAARNRWALATGALALAAVVALSLHYAERLRRERDAAQREAAKARQVSLFLTDLFAASDPFSAEQVAGRTALELLDAGASAITEGASLEGQPETRAALLDVIGTVYGELSRSEPALRYNQQALELRERLLGPAHADTLESRLHRVILERLAGNFERSQQLARELIPRLEAHLGARDWRVGEARKQLARCLVDTSALEEAAAMIEGAIAIEEAQRPPDARRLAQMIVVQSSISGRRGNFERAVGEGRRSIELLREAAATDTTIANALMGLAGNLQNLGRTDEAMAALREGERLVLASAGQEHPLALKLSLRIAGLSILLEQYDEGMRRLEAHLPIAERVIGPTNAWVAGGYRSRSMALADTGRPAEAVVAARRGRDVMVAIYGPESPISLDAERSLAGILHDAGRRTEARDLYRRVIAACDAQPSPSIIVLSGSLYGLANVLLELGDGAGAEQAVDRALRLRRELWPEGHIDIVRTLASRAEVHLLQREKAEARAAIEEARELAARVEGETPALRERLERLARELSVP